MSSKIHFSMIFCIVHASSTNGVSSKPFSFSFFSKEIAPQLSFDQKFQLDFLEQELEKNNDMLHDDWDNINAQIILEDAELAVQNCPDATKDILKQRIVALFENIGISIEFTDDNLIIKTDTPDDQTLKKLLSSTTTKKKVKLKKQHAPRTGTDQPAKRRELQKIKGARRTLRRVKQKMADQRAAQEAKDLAEIRRKAAYQEKQRNANKILETVKAADFVRMIDFQHQNDDRLHEQEGKATDQARPAPEHIELLT
jgi:hypothetical protein